MFFFVSLRLYTEVRRAFIKRSCTFVHFRPLVRFFRVLFDQILFQRGCQVQLFMLFLNIEFKLTTPEILNSKVLSTKICLQSHLELFFAVEWYFKISDFQGLLRLKLVFKIASQFHNPVAKKISFRKHIKVESRKVLPNLGCNQMGFGAIFVSKFMTPRKCKIVVRKMHY